MSSERIYESLPNDSDEEFDAIFPIKIQKLSSRHWTPVKVVKRATRFLIQKEGTKVLDIGSGAGKFCLVGASVSSGIFTGVERREPLVHLSRKIAQKYEVKRVNFFHANMLSINFKEYDSFYFFNSFEENRDLTDSIDQELMYSPSNYEAYHGYIYRQFEALPEGTRIVTYCSPRDSVPDSYVLVRSELDETLKFYEKKH